MVRLGHRAGDQCCVLQLRRGSSNFTLGNLGELLPGIVGGRWLQYCGRLSIWLYPGQGENSSLKGSVRSSPHCPYHVIPSSSFPLPDVGQSLQTCPNSKRLRLFSDQRLPLPASWSWQLEAHTTSSFTGTQDSLGVARACRRLYRVRSHLA